MEQKIAKHTQRVTKIEAAQRILLGIGLLMVMTVSAVSLGVYVFERTPLYYKDKMFSTTKKSYVQGDYISAEVERCNVTDHVVTFTVTKVLQPIDPTREDTYSLGSVLVTAVPGCHKTTTTTSVIPDNVQPGNYIIHGKAEITGLTKKFYSEWYTEPFTVTEDKCQPSTRTHSGKR